MDISLNHFSICLLARLVTRKAERRGLGLDARTRSLSAGAECSVDGQGSRSWAGAGQATETSRAAGAIQVARGCAGARVAGLRGQPPGRSVLADQTGVRDRRPAGAVAGDEEPRWFVVLGPSAWLGAERAPGPGHAVRDCFASRSKSTDQRAWLSAGGEEVARPGSPSAGGSGRTNGRQQTLSFGPWALGGNAARSVADRQRLFVACDRPRPAPDEPFAGTPTLSEKFYPRRQGDLYLGGAAGAGTRLSPAPEQCPKRPKNNKQPALLTRRAG